MLEVKDEAEIIIKDNFSNLEKRIKIQITKDNSYGVNIKFHNFGKDVCEYSKDNLLDNKNDVEKMISFLINNEFNVNQVDDIIEDYISK